MRLVCGPENFEFPEKGSLNVVLYGHANKRAQASAGVAAFAEVARRQLEVAPRAWDFLSIALAIVTADLAHLRRSSPDGWTREFDLLIAVTDAQFWGTQREALERALAFLTTDRWQISFVEGGVPALVPEQRKHLEEDCVVLLSGGLDSLIGAIDLVAKGRRPCAVSQIVRGDAAKQLAFAHKIGGGLEHLQLNHGATPPGAQEKSQRARSLAFLAFGILAGTTLDRHHAGEPVTLYICENGFIGVNPPLTSARIASLSTRTAHPIFLTMIQAIVDAAGLRIRVENPYRLQTKGEMLVACLDQALLRAEAPKSTSCGRFLRFNYTHCGRCVPCQIRRAAFLRWGRRDTTKYVYRNLGRSGPDRASFDDVRSAAMAIAEVEEIGLDSWLGVSLSSEFLDDAPVLAEMVGRGLDELAQLHRRLRVR